MAIPKTTILFSTVLLSALLFAVATVDAASAPPPAADCSTVVLGLVDCLSYINNGSTEKKPQGKCCSGLKTVLKTNADCLCEAFKNSAQLGVTLNLTRAMALPSACGVSSSSISQCADNAPVPAPDATVSPSPSSGDSDHNKVAPAPPPGNSASTVLVASLVSILFALVASSLSYF